MNRPFRNLALLLLLFGLAACGPRAPDGLSPQELALHNQAMGLMGRFEYAEALTRFSDLARRHPEDPDLAVDRAIATLNRQLEGDEAAALQILAGVLQRAPHHLRALYTSGLLELNGGRPGPAEARLRQVAEADPADAYAAYHLALSLAQQGRDAEALAWYRKAIGTDAWLRSAYYGAFQVLRRSGRREEAREMLDRYQALATDPRARRAEFKYTRMGPKAEVVALESGPAATAGPPAGPLFAAPVPLSAGRDLSQRASLTAADIDGDGRSDLFVADAAGCSAVLLAAAAGGFVPQPDHPLSGLDKVNTALWGDIDDDGLLDVYLCRRGPNRLWRQRAAGRWQAVASEVLANGAADTVDGALFDADHDGDLDLFLVNADAPNELLNNDRDGSFRPLAQELGLTGHGPGRSLVVTDLDRDRDTDLVVINAEPPHEVYLNGLMWSYRAAPGFAALRQAPLAAALAHDRDADGRPELYTLGDAGVARWQPDAGGQWRATLLSPVPAGREAELALLDLDGDGAGELVRSTADGWGAYRIADGRLEALATAGRPGVGRWIPCIGDVAAGPSIVALDGAGGLLLWPPGSGRHPFIGLTFSGMEDAGQSMRSNASGIGVHLALRRGAHWSVLEGFRRYSGPGQGLQPLAIGLGGAARADFLAIRWSDGVYQTELGLEPGRLHAIAETQRQLSSCPVLFAWDGARYRFVSDLLGVGGIGFAIGRGEYAEPRPRESFQLPAGLLQPSAGRYLLKLTEPMEEAAYLDAARLTAYELPPGWHMVLDERMSVLGPEPDGAPRFYREEMLPVQARSGAGEVLAAVTEADLKAAPVGPPDHRFIGRLAGEHVLELEFPRPLDAGTGEPLLAIDGWVEYPYSQTLFAAWQAGADYRAPSLDYRGADGRWHTLLEQFGYPAGMPRRMSVPLAGLPAGVTRLRLRTNQEIYWDRIAVAWAATPPQLKRRALPLRAARVRAGGFPMRSTGPQRLPHYDYDRRLPLWDTRHMAGFYTEFGDALPLVARVDDALAVFGPGEEIQLEFDAPAEAPPPGWRRTLVLETNGWAKDMDLYTKDGATLGPLPALKPPGERRARLHARFNTRYRSGS